MNLQYAIASHLVRIKSLFETFTPFLHPKSGQKGISSVYKLFTQPHDIHKLPSMEY